MSKKACDEPSSVIRTSRGDRGQVDPRGQQAGRLNDEIPQETSCTDGPNQGVRSRPITYSTDHVLLLHFLPPLVLLPPLALFLLRPRLFNVVSQRLVVCLAASLPGMQLYLQDMTQAYVQSATSSNRDFFMYPPAELANQPGISVKSVLKVVKNPLYGVPEAGNHWVCTITCSHHIERLGMTQSTYDPCLLHIGV